MKKSLYLAFLAVSVFALTNCMQNQNADVKKIIFTANAPKPIGPYSQAVMVGNTLYISGQIAIDPANGKLDTTDISSQTKRVMENLKAILAEAGMDFSNVVKTSIFLVDMANFPKVNDVYGQYFQANPPARETVQVAALPKKANIEISMIAHK